MAHACQKAKTSMFFASIRLGVLTDSNCHVSIEVAPLEMVLYCYKQSEEGKQRTPRHLGCVRQDVIQVALNKLEKAELEEMPGWWDLEGDQRKKMQVVWAQTSPAFIPRITISIYMNQQQHLPPNPPAFPTSPNDIGEETLATLERGRVEALHEYPLYPHLAELQKHNARTQPDRYFIQNTIHLMPGATMDHYRLIFSHKPWRSEFDYASHPAAAFEPAYEGPCEVYFKGADVLREDALMLALESENEATRRFWRLACTVALQTPPPKLCARYIQIWQDNCLGDPTALFRPGPTVVVGHVGQPVVGLQARSNGEAQDAREDLSKLNKVRPWKQVLMLRGIRASMVSVDPRFDWKMISDLKGSLAAFFMDQIEALHFARFHTAGMMSNRSVPPVHDRTWFSNLRRNNPGLLVKKRRCAFFLMS